MIKNLTQFDKQNYLNLESFRRNGQGVKTLVWFAQEADSLFVWTERFSGKSKRIRNNCHVRIVPCKLDGSPIGDWLAASAVTDESDAALRHIQGLMEKKYGLMFMVFRLSGLFRHSKYTSIQLDLKNEH
jgi:PPOX class probable F420-dependent enzyme